MKPCVRHLERCLTHMKCSINLIIVVDFKLAQNMYPNFSSSFLNGKGKKANACNVLESFASKILDTKEVLPILLFTWKFFLHVILNVEVLWMLCFFLVLIYCYWQAQLWRWDISLEVLQCVVPGFVQIKRQAHWNLLDLWLQQVRHPLTFQFKQQPSDISLSYWWQRELLPGLPVI